MGMWQVPVDLLARASFRRSPMAEVVGALQALRRPVDTIERGFQATHGEAFDSMLALHPDRAAVLEASYRERTSVAPGWAADYLGFPPRTADETYEDELARIAAVPEERMREYLIETMRRPLPAEFDDIDSVAAATGLLNWVWTQTVASDWPRRSRLLDADIVARTAVLASKGWAATVDGLGRQREWLADGRLRINAYDLPDRVLPPDAELSFVPTLGSGNWAGWDNEKRYAVFYAISGRLASPSAERPDGLDRLIGRNRANVLRLLVEPASTTALVARTGMSLGAVGNQLAILLRAGAVIRRRSGRSVLYWRSPLGDALAAAGDPDPWPAGRGGSVSSSARDQRRRKQ